MRRGLDENGWIVDSMPAVELAATASNRVAASATDLKYGSACFDCKSFGICVL